MRKKGPIQLVQPQVHQVEKQSEKGRGKKNSVSYDTILNDALEGVALGVEKMTDIISDEGSDNKDKIAASKMLLEILMKIAEVKVVQDLPLLKLLEEKCRQA
jgi:hypothetical protein